LKPQLIYLAANQNKGALEATLITIPIKKRRVESRLEQYTSHAG